MSLGAADHTTAGLGAVVLTGGSAVRLQGADKAGIEIAGVTLLEHALGALAEVPEVIEVVVVGEEVPTTRPVTFRREDPPGGGPGAGLLAGLGGFARRPRQVLVLAVDMPMVTAATVRRLADALKDPAVDGAMLVDADGRAQYLCGIYDVVRLLELAPSYEERHGIAVRRLLAGLRLVEVPAVGAEARDVDTWEDLLQLRTALEQ